MAVLQRVFPIRVGKTQQVVSEVILRVLPVELERALRRREKVLIFPVQLEAAAHLQLVGAFAPGNRIQELICVVPVVPRYPVRGVVRAGTTRELDRWDAVQVVRAGEDSVKVEA